MVLRGIGYSAGGVIGLLGLIFILSVGSEKNGNPVSDGIVGLVLLGIAAAIFVFLIKKAPDHIKRVEITQKVDLSGDTELEAIKCRSCGAELDSDSIKVQPDGSVTVHCGYCGSVYQITEKPTW